MPANETAAPLSQIQQWPLERFVFYARNPRKNDAAVERMCASLREFGFKVPVLVRSDGEVVDGHLRLKAAKKLGSWPGGDVSAIPVILCDEWSAAQVKAFRLLVNRSVTWADWDEELLRLELLEIQESDFDLSLTGFNVHEIDALLVDPEEDERANAVPPVPAVAVSRVGDLWLCGQHRVLCGDSTKAEDVARLLGERKPTLMVTDPPYGIELDAEWRDRAGLNGCGPAEASYMKRAVRDGAVRGPIEAVANAAATAHGDATHLPKQDRAMPARGADACAANDVREAASSDGEDTASHSNQTHGDIEGDARNEVGRVIHGAARDARGDLQSGSTGEAKKRASKQRTVGHTNTSISSDTRADWSEAFELVPSLQVAYVWHASVFTREVLNGLLRIGFLYPQQIIWNKGRTVLTRTHYWYQHEPCWYVRKPRAPWFGKAGENSTVWDSPSPKFIMGGSDEQKFDHPTQKPVELMRRPILNHTQRGELVYEPFLGSGTTLAAAELTERACCGIELDAKYVDVVVQRWQTLSGKQARLDGDGRTFDEIADARRSEAA